MKTTKLVLAAMSAIILSTSASAGAMEIESFSDELTVYLNGTNVYANSENKPFIMNERTMVPLRPIFEAMGIGEDNIIYIPDPEQAMATFSDGRTSCTFYNDSTSVTRSDETSDIKTIELDVPATIYNGNFYIPLRAFCNLWYMGIEWDDATRSVFVTGNITAESISTQPASDNRSSAASADGGDKLIADLRDYVGTWYGFGTDGTDAQTAPTNLSIDSDGKIVLGDTVYNLIDNNTAESANDYQDHTGAYNSKMLLEFGKDSRGELALCVYGIHKSDRQQNTEAMCYYRESTRTNIQDFIKN